MANELAAFLSCCRVSGSRRASVTDSATWSQAPIKVAKADLISSSPGPLPSATFRYVDLRRSPNSPKLVETVSQGSSGGSVVGSVS